MSTHLGVFLTLDGWGSAQVAFSEHQIGEQLPACTMVRIDTSSCTDELVETVAVWLEEAVGRWIEKEPPRLWTEA
jgi:hypothetical protein